MDNLVNEMLHIKIQYKLDEGSFVSMLVSQFSTEAKNFMRSVLGTQGNLTVLPLERILENARAIFFDVDLEHIHAQSKNLTRNIGEPSIAFFSRISAISKLASFHLDTEAERESYKHTNVREQFLRNINKKIQYLIKQRELVNGTTYAPAELFRMHLSFEQSENENKAHTYINKISTDLDLTQAFPSMHTKQKGNNPSKKGNNPSKKQQNTVCPNANKMNYGEARAKPSNRNLYKKNQIRQVSFKEGEKKGRTRPLRMTDESVAKRKMLGFNGPGIIKYATYRPKL
jgi:hypothetical protein